jgi:hypothetical protein
MDDNTPPNKVTGANRRPAGLSSGSGNLFVPLCGIATDRAFPAAVAELGR